MNSETISFGFVRASALVLLGSLSLAGGCAATHIEIGDLCDGDSRRTAGAFRPNIAQTGWVTDQAGILNSSFENHLASKLSGFEHVTGHQIVVVTVSSLGGRDAKDYAIDLANAWAIGRATEDDGVLFLVAPNKQKVYIATGCGLVQTLPDAEVKRILDEKVLPQFQRDEIPLGIELGVNALIDLLKLS